MSDKNFHEIPIKSFDRSSIQLDMMVKSLYFSRNRVLSRYTQVGKRLMFEVDNAKEPAILKGYQVAIRTQGVQPESREHFLCFINESVPFEWFHTFGLRMP